jgi:amylosucrase
LPAACPSRRIRAPATRASPARWPRWPGWKRRCTAATRRDRAGGAPHLLLHSIILSIGGIPLIYLGDEIGTLNDYSYVDDPAKAGDSRWVHRPATDWAKMERRHDPATLEGRIYGGLRHLIQVRKATRAFAGNQMQRDQRGQRPRLRLRAHGPEGQRVVVLANFSEQPQSLATEVRLSQRSPALRPRLL